MIGVWIQCQDCFQPLRRENNSVPHRHPQFNTSVQHKEQTFSEPEIPQFNTKKPFVQHPFQFNNPLSSTHPSVRHTPHFNTPLSSTTPSVQHQKPFSSSYWWFFLLNLGVCWTEGCVELRGVLNWGVCWIEGGGWTERFLVMNWGILGFELKESLWL